MPTAQAAFLMNGVLSHWPADERPEIENVTLQQFINDERIQARTACAWVILDQFRSDRFNAAASVLEERNIPTMLTRPHEIGSMGYAFQPGVVLGPQDAPTIALCAILRALWGQVDMMEHLKTEVQYLRAHQGGLCDQMGKIDEELRLAAQLQREFLPTELPAVEDVECQILFRPASYVSGDIYDVMRLDENHVGFFLADAVGHGVPAALMTMYIKRSLRTKEIDRDSPSGYRVIRPAEALASLNIDICNQSTDKMRFATAVYGVLNTQTRELEIARAGHPYPLLMRADGGTQWLEPEGAMLGIFAEEVFETAKIIMNPGDRLLLYSDGFELAFPKGDASDPQAEGLANNEYAKAFMELTNLSLADAIQALAVKLDTQSGSLNQRDDMTAIFMGIQAEQQQIIEPGKRMRPEPVIRVAG